LESLCRRLASGITPEPPGTPAVIDRPRKPKRAPVALESPEFPREEPGQRIRFWVEVAGWAARSAWVLFRRLPRWMRAVATVWICIAVVSRCDSSKHDTEDDISPAKAAKLKAIAERYQGSEHKNDIVSLGAEIAKTFADDAQERAAANSPLLAVPFTAPAGDAAAAKLADSAFAIVYGRLSIAHHGDVGLSTDPLPSRELGAALERGRANHSTYVLYGTIDTDKNAPALTVKFAAVADGSVTWSKSFPAAGADPAKIAGEVEANIPPLATK
jgi:hypothetical protein